MASGDLVGGVSSEQFLPSAVFDGDNDYIEIPHSVRKLGINLSNGFTISAWVNPQSVGEGTTNAGVIFDMSSANGGINGFSYFMRQTNNCVGFHIKNTTTTRISATNSVPFNTWTRVLITVTAAQIANHYINGVTSGTPGDLTNTIADIIATNNPRIGNRAGGTDRSFDGSIAKVQMWNRVLTAAEIANDYAGKLVSDGLIVHYKLDGNAYDSSQFANDGTASGAYFTNVDFNNIIADVRNINLAAATDKLLVVPMFGRNGQIVVVSANRTA